MFKALPPASKRRKRPCAGISSCRRSAMTLAVAAVGLLVSVASQADFLTPIPAYGDNGTAIFSVGSGFTLSDSESGGIVAAATADSDGRLYVLYRAVPSTDSNSHLYLIRLGSSGVLDNGFGPLDFGLSAAVDNNVALGLDQSRQRFYLVTLPPTPSADFITVSARRFDNSLDPAFNGGADLVINSARIVDNRYSLAATVDQVSGRLLLSGAFIVGTVSEDTLSNLEAVTYAVTPDGQLDPGFNSNGLRIESPPSSFGITSALGFGIATSSTTGRILNFGSGRVSPSRFVGTIFSDNADGTVDATFGSGGLGVIDITSTTPPSEGQANLTQLLFGRILPSGVTQLIGVNGVLQLSNRTYVTGTTSVAGVQLTPAGVPDTRFKSTGIFTTPFAIGRAPPTVLFANGSFASVFKSGPTDISVLAVEGFSVFAEDGTTGGTTTGGTTTGGATTGGTTGGTTTGGTTTGGTTTGGTTTGSTTGTTSSGGGSFGLFGLVGLVIGALLRRRRGLGEISGG